MESDNHWLVTTGLVTSSVIALTTNALLLLIFCKRRALRTVPNRFVINLLITNVLSSILLIPLLLFDQKLDNGLSTNANGTSMGQEVYIREDIISENEDEILVDSNKTNIEIVQTTRSLVTETIIVNETSTNEYLCNFAQSGTNFICTASIFSILLIGINQYFGVMHSLRYHFYINKSRSMIFIVTGWLVALIFGVFSSVTHCNASIWQFCSKNQYSSQLLRIFNTIYAFTYFIVVILAPFVAICVIYVCIYTAAHKNSQRMRKSTSAPITAAALDIFEERAASEDKIKIENNHRKSIPKVHSAPDFMNLQTESSLNNNLTPKQDNLRNKVVRTCSDRITNNFITSLKYKISNSSVFKYREETRAAKISILIILMVLICYIPYGTAIILNSGLVAVKTPKFFNNFALVSLIFSNVISPFLFGYRNKRVKREMAKMFGLVPPKTDSLPTMERNKKPMVRNRSFENVRDRIDTNTTSQPFLKGNYSIPEVIVTFKQENERKSILKRVCDTTNWPSYKKCSLIAVPESCISAEGRGSFSSASTQISEE